MAEKCRSQHDLSNSIRMSNRNVQRNGTAVAEAKQIGLANPKMIEQRGCVVGKLLEGERSFGDVRRVTVPLAFKRYYATALRELGKYRTERRLDGIATAVKQHERRHALVRLSIHFVIKLDAVNRCKHFSGEARSA